MGFEGEVDQRVVGRADHSRPRRDTGAIACFRFRLAAINPDAAVDARIDLVRHVDAVIVAFAPIKNRQFSVRNLKRNTIDGMARRRSDVHDNNVAIETLARHGADVMVVTGNDNRIVPRDIPSAPMIPQAALQELMFQERRSVQIFSQGYDVDQ